MGFETKINLLEYLRNYGSFEVTIKSFNEDDDLVPSDTVKIFYAYNGAKIELIDRHIVKIVEYVPEVLTFQLICDGNVLDELEYDETPEWQIDLDEYEYEDGKHVIALRAVGDGINANMSNEVYYYTGTTLVEFYQTTGVTYGFTLKDTGYYESTNKGRDSTFSMCELHCICNNPEDYPLILQCINSGEANYDYGIISQPNKTLSKSNSDDGASGSTNVFKNFKGQSSTNPVTITIPLPLGESIVYIKFRKDSSASSGNDSLQFKILNEN